MSDIKLSVIADVLLKGGKIDSTELDKVINAYLRKQALPDLVLDPKIKVSRKALAQARAEFRAAARALQAIADGEFDNVSDAMERSIGQAFAGLKPKQAEALKRIFTDFDTLLGTPQQTKFSKDFRRKMQAVAQDSKNFFRLTDQEKILAKEYLALTKQVEGNLTSLANRARSLSKSLGAQGFADPLMTPQIGAAADRTKDFTRRLKQHTDANALMAKAYDEALRLDKDYVAERAKLDKAQPYGVDFSKSARKRAEERSRLFSMERKYLDELHELALKDNEKFDRERAQAEQAEDRRAERRNKEYIRNQRRRAKERAKADQEATRGAQSKVRAEIGQDLINVAPAGLRDLSQVPTQNLPLIADTLRSKIADTKAQLESFKASDAYDAQGVRAQRLIRQIDYLNSKLAETNRLQRAGGKKGDEFVGPQDNPAYRNLQQRYAYGEEIVNRAGGLGGVSNIPRSQLPLAREYLQTSISNLKDLEKGIDLSTAKGKREFDALTGRIQQTSDALAKVEQRQRGFGTATQQTGALMRQFFRYALGYGALYEVLAAVRALTVGVIDLDTALKSIKAITGSTDSAMRVIEASIKRVALVTKFTTSEIAKAAQVLAQAGTEAKDFTGALSAVSLFASATESSIETAADLVSTMRNVYKDLDDLTIANQLTQAVNISKLTADGLKTILSRGAQVAQSYNLASEQYLAAVAVLRNAGIKDSTVATGLRQGLIELLSPDDKTLKVLVKRYQELGENLSKEQVKGRFFGFSQEDNPLISVLQEYKRLGFSGAAKADFERIFDVRAQNAIEPLIKNIDQLAEAEMKLTFGNAALSASQTQMEALSHSVSNLGAAITVLADGLSGDLVDGLENVADAATKVIEELTTLDARMKATGGVGLSTALGAGIVSGGLAAITSGGGALSKVGRFAGGAAVGAGGAYLGMEAAGQADAGEGAAKAAAYVTAIGSVLLVFDALTSIGGKAAKAVKGSSSALKGITRLSDLFLNMGVFFERIKLGALSKLLVRGAAHPVIAGILTITGIIALIDTFFSKDTLEQAKAKLKQAQENRVQLRVDRQTEEAALSEFELSQPGKAAKEGSTAKSVEDLRRDIANFNSAADAVIQAKAEDFGAVRELLIRIGTEGAEAGSEVRKQLLGELQKLSPADLTGSAETDRLISGLATTAASLQSRSTALRDSIKTKITAIRETEGELELVDEAFLASYQALTQDQQAFNELNGLVSITPERAEQLATALLNGITEYVKASEKTKEAIERENEAKRQELERAVEVIRRSGSANDAYTQVRLLIEGAGDLSNAMVEYLEEFRKVLDEAERGLGKGSFVDNVIARARAFFTGQKNPLDSLHYAGPERQLEALRADKSAAEARYRASIRESDPQYLKDAEFVYPFQHLIDELEQQVNIEAGRRAADDSEKAIREGIKAANAATEKKVETRRQSLVTEISNPEFQSQLAGMPDDQQKAIKEFMAGGKPLTEPDTRKGKEGLITETALFKTVDSLLAQFSQRQSELKKEEASFFPEDLAARRRIFDLEEEIKLLKKTNPEQAKVKIIELRDLKVQGAQQRAAFESNRLENDATLTKSGEQAARKEIQDQQIAIVKYAAEAKGEIDQINNSLKQRSLDNQKKLLDLQAQEIDRHIKTALDTGDVSELQRLEDQRIDVMRQQYALELEELRAKGEDLETVQSRQQVQEQLLQLAQEEARDASRIVSAVKARLSIMERTPTTGSLTDDGTREAAGVPYTLGQQRTALDANIAANQQALGSLRGERDAYESSIALPPTAAGAAQLQEYGKAIEELEKKLAGLKYERDNLDSSLATELSQGFDAEAIAAGIENLDGRLGNLGETIRDDVVQGWDEMGDAIADSVVRGENALQSLRQVAGQVMADIAADIIKSGILKLGASIFSGSLFGGWFSKGGTVEAKASGGVIKAASGYVGGVIKGRGTGTSDSIPGVVVDDKGRVTRGIRVSNNESILTAEATSRMGEDFINFANANPKAAGELIRALQSAPLRRATGGVVDSQRSVQKSAVPAGTVKDGSSYTYNSNITVEGGGQQNQQDMRALNVLLDMRVKQILTNEQRPGGLLNRRH